jgi:hypothetical protein
VSHNPEFDVWRSAIETIHPDIDKLTEIMSAGSKVMPELTRKGRGWQIQLVEMWNIDNNPPMIFRSSQLDTHIIWTTEQLETWPKVKRMAWDMWQFSSKRDAEKFITLYNIVWPQ